MELNSVNDPRLTPNRLTRIALTGLLIFSQIQGYCLAQGLPNGVDLRYDTLRNKPERNLSTPGNEFGDSHSLENGALSFNVVDVSIPGDNSLPVEFRRSLRLTEPRGKYGYPNTSLADWEIDLPKIAASYDAQAGWITSDSSRPTKNCSVAQKSYVSPPPTISYPNSFPIHTFWNPPKVHFPNGSSQLLVYNEGVMPAPQAGGPYYWLTSSMDYASCLPTIKNTGGTTWEEQRYSNLEGYLVIRPDGTKYWFDWLARENRTTAFTTIPFYGSPGGTGTITMAQVALSLYPTRIEDRFGNWVTYTYSNKSSEKIQIDRIDASDGRNITITNTGNRVSAVAANGRTWQFIYSTTPGFTQLVEVINPDQSSWRYSGDSHPSIDAAINRDYGSCSNPASWTGTQNPDGTSGQNVVGVKYHVTAPSGAQAEFEVQRVMLGRTGVQQACYISGYTTAVTGYPTSIIEPTLYLGGWTLALIKKRVTGAGIDERLWKYHYQSDIGFFPTTNGTSRTKVLHPDGALDTYAYGNVYQLNEGLLLKRTRSKLGLILETQDYSYAVDRGSATFPKKIGFHPYIDSNEYPNIYLRPTKSVVVTRDSGTFTSGVSATCETSGTALCFDAYGRQTSVNKSNSLGYGKTEATTYLNDLSQWVLGLPLTSSVNGIEVSKTDYNAQRLPWKTYRFGKLQQILSYWPDGNLNTVTDGRGNTTWAGDYYRGIPRLIRHPATAESPAGATESATVDTNGWITSVTDENGFSHAYAYDSMGRLAGIGYPANDSIAWLPKAFEFRALNSNDWLPSGISIGQWRHYEGQGNYAKFTYYDAMWRPILVHEYDAANVGPTLRSSRMTYDANGRQNFQSYVSSDLIPGNNGTRTFYDALDRVTRVEQDSEHGVLATTTEYLANLQTRVVNPRGLATVTGFMAWDQPMYDLPIASVQPEGKVIEIARHPLFGWPLQLKQRSADNALQASRQYVYDDHAQLCKTIEPETGATVMVYDEANNLTHSWAGLDLPDPNSCNHDEAWQSGRLVWRRYTARNQVDAIRFTGGRGDQNIAYTPDGLQAIVTSYNDANYGTPVITAYHYNKRRLLTGESSSQPGWYTWGLGYEYDALGNVGTLVYPTGLRIGLWPNALGQSTQVADQHGTAYATGAQYYPNGALKQFTYGNGIVHTMHQNSRQLPERVISSGGVLDYHHYYDRNGNVEHIANNLVAGWDPRDRWMQYDGLDRLTAAGSGSFGGDHWHRFTYDALDNIKSWKLGGVKDYADYVYNAKNQLTNIRNSAAATIVGLSYDPQGNLWNKNGQDYDFDYGNRLRSVIGKEYYRYDGSGRRVLTWRPAGVAGPAASLSLFQYSQSGQLMYEEHSDKPNGVHVYLAGSLVATRHGDGAVKYQHTDALGSPVAVTNEAGAVIERNDYEPWGAIIGKPNYSGIGYTGHMMDGVSGLTYMQQRYYDQSLGRFLSVDPVTANSANGSNFNRYKYAANNPYRFIDPDGRQERAYGAAATLFMSPEQRRIWEGGERAALTEGSGAEQGAAMMDAAKSFASNPQVSREAFVKLAVVLAIAKLSHGRSGGPMHGPSPRIHEGQQGKHQVGHNNYTPGRSVLTADPSKLATHAGTGQQVGKIEVGLPGSKERVDFGQNIGTTVDKAGNASSTTVGIIHYGKNGIHIVPAKSQP